MSYWLDNATGPQHTLVDCGYVTEAVARQRADRILKYVSRTNAQIVGANRIVVRIPPRKLKAVLDAIPEIKEGAGTYCWCTHGFPASTSTAGRSK